MSMLAIRGLLYKWLSLLGVFIFKSLPFLHSCILNSVGIRVPVALGTLPGLPADCDSDVAEGMSLSQTSTSAKANKMRQVQGCLSCRRSIGASSALDQRIQKAR